MINYRTNYPMKPNLYEVRNYYFKFILKGNPNIQDGKKCDGMHATDAREISGWLIDLTLLVTVLSLILKSWVVLSLTLFVTVLCH